MALCKKSAPMGVSILLIFLLNSCGPTVSQKSVWDFYHDCEYSHESIIKIVQCGNAARNNHINMYVNITFWEELCKMYGTTC